ncbi:MAG: HAD family hydrolase [Eubacterium sp.]|nr:HAD family hydrolase [Eubacterium sp.]
MNTVLFDLDGTLLPMDMKEFTDTYMMLLENRLRSSGYDEATDIIDAVWAGVAAMTQNDGLRTNEECFWSAFEQKFTKKDEKPDRKYRRKIEKEINRFYKEDFSISRYVTHPTELVNEVIDILKKKGYQIVLATNPIFPEVATLERLSWTGLNPEDFSLITTFENSCFTKPKLEYYQYILKTLYKDPEDCLMVGNDVQEDMCARQLGIDVFLIDEYVLNAKNEDVFDLKKGNWRLFKEYVSALPDLN